MMPHQFKALKDLLGTELASIRGLIQEQIRAIRDTSEATNQARKEIPLKLSELHIPENERAEERTYRKRSHTVQVLLALGTWLAFIAAGIYAAIAYRQLCVSNRLLVEAQKASSATEVAMKIDERAWASVFNIQPGPKGAPIITIEFINTGKTPAKNFKIAAAGDVGKMKSSETEIPGNGVIAPSGKFSSFMHANGVFTSSTQVAIHGRVSYESVFGVPHWTTFCYYLIPKRDEVPAGFAPCKSGNEIDSNPEK